MIFGMRDRESYTKITVMIQLDTIILPSNYLYLGVVIWRQKSRFTFSLYPIPTADLLLNDNLTQTMATRASLVCLFSSILSRLGQKIRQTDKYFRFCDYYHNDYNNNYLTIC